MTKYVALLALLTLASCVLVFVQNPGHAASKVLAIATQHDPIADSELPTLGDIASFPQLSAQGVIAVDLDSAVVLYEKNPDQRLLPASTTKIVTALVALDTYPLDQVVSIGNVSVIGQRMHLLWGEKITVYNLLQGLLIYSANDAAEALAQQYPEGRDAFIAAMNAKATELGLTNSHFSNPIGLDAPDQYSSARDLVRVSEVAMRNPTFASIVATKTSVVKSVDGKFIHPLKNVNELLGKVDGVVGVKTGWTEGARENLVTQVNRNNKRILITLLGSQDRFGETTELIDWIFKNVNWQTTGYLP
jgi:D-alanyl-D-alanine carboxypeptidase (penicillin-binding protein 5/6)